MSYNERAAKADREYEAGYAEAIADLPRKDRIALHQAGLHKPAAETYRTPRAPRDDEEEDPRAQGVVQTDIAAQVDKLEDWMMEAFDLDERQALQIAKWHRGEIERASEKLQAFLFQRIVAGFLKPGNVKLRAYGLAIAAGLDALNGLSSQKAAAKIIGVSKQAVSGVVNYWADTLGLPRNKFMKDEAARKSYSEERKSNHWRKQRCKAKTS